MAFTGPISEVESMPAFNRSRAPSRNTGQPQHRSACPPGRCLLQLCLDQESEVVAPDGTLQRPQDGVGIVVRPLDEEGLAVTPEPDRARARPRPQLAGGRRKARGGLEPEAARIRD